MSAYRDKSQWWVFAFPEGNYKMTSTGVQRDIQTAIDTTATQAEEQEDQKATYKELEEIFKEGLILLKESQEPFEDIIAYTIDRLRKVQGE